MNQTCEGHSGSVICSVWNPKHAKLTTADTNGLIIVWMLHKGMWFEEMINNRNKSTVADIKWSKNGEKIAICYEDGNVIVGSVGGKRQWGKDLPLRPKKVDWSPCGRFLLFGTHMNEAHIYDSLGNPVSSIRTDMASGNTSLIAVDWFDTKNKSKNAHPSLAIAFENGHVQLCKSETDGNPLLLRTGLRLTHCKWNAQGTVLSVAGAYVAGSDGREVNAVHFYSPAGSLLSSLKVPGQKINALTWEASGLRVALAVDSFIYFANIVPEYQWGYFGGDTLVYAAGETSNSMSSTSTSQNSTEREVIFWDVKANTTTSKYVWRLLKIKAAGEVCVLVTGGEGSDVGGYNLALCNTLGSPVETKQIQIEPLFVAMTDAFVVCASHSSVIVWRYGKPSDRSGFGSVDTEKTFHIDGICDGDSSFINSKPSQHRKPKDPIAAIDACDKTLIVGLKSGTVLTFKLPDVALIHKCFIKSRPKALNLNCSGTKFTVIDASGVLSMFEVPVEGTIGGSNNEKELQTKLSPKFQRKDAWQSRWSLDDENLLATMEKTKMFVWRNSEPEEPCLSSGHVCCFSELTIKGVILDEVIGNNQNQDTSNVVSFETKSLWDTRRLLSNPDTTQDAIAFVEDNSHPRLWRLVANHALEVLDLPLADKAFVKCCDYHGITFVKRLVSLNDKEIKKAEVKAYFKNFDEAERTYLDIGRGDLAVELRKHLGDWFRVEKLIQNENVHTDDSKLQESWNNIGLYFFDRLKFKKAAPYFQKAANVKKLVTCYSNLGDYKNLELLIDEIIVNGSGENTHLLLSIATTFRNVGMCQQSVSAYIKAGDVKAAIATCVSLSQWDLAVDLAEEHGIDNMGTDRELSKYAEVLLEKNAIPDAIDLYEKAGKFLEASKLFVVLAKNLADESPANAAKVKKLFMLSALSVGKHKKVNALKAGKGGIGLDSNQRRTQSKGQIDNTLDGLLDLSDANSTTKNKSADLENETENPWHAAEAYHFWLLAHKQLYDERYEYCRRTALVLENYTDVFDTKQVYSLIALTSYYAGHYGRCSMAFSKLENLEPENENSSEYSDLATAIFLQHAPVDPVAKKNGEDSLNSFGVNKAGGVLTHVCVASGRQITIADTTETCAVCGKRCIAGELRGSQNCPLCRTSFQQSVSDDERTAKETYSDDASDEVFSPTAPQRMKNSYF